MKDKGEPMQGGGWGKNGAGIGNVPKLLYRRSIYGDEKHSLPSTPVAPAKGSRQPRSAVRPSTLTTVVPVGDREEEGGTLSISVCNQPFHQFGDIARRITFGMALPTMTAVKRRVIDYT